VESKREKLARGSGLSVRRGWGRRRLDKRVRRRKREDEGE